MTNGSTKVFKKLTERMTYKSLADKQDRCKSNKMCNACIKLLNLNNSGYVLITVVGGAHENNTVEQKQPVIITHRDKIISHLGFLPTLFSNR